MARPRKSRPPWGDLFVSDAPLERFISISNDFTEEWDRNLARQQFEMMSKLKDHYGIEGALGWRPWYELALKLACELDKKLMIVDPAPQSKGKTSPKWRGSKGEVLLNEVKAIQSNNPNKSIRWCLKTLKEWTPERYGMPLDQLVVRYSEAKKHHEAKPRELKKKHRTTK
jgi:hypothetical protein